ncbi:MULTISPECIES: hypothetical protein [Nonomuraea]|uniref:Uncharacterized protein n=2 Tax=Nonomuraea TaxID=83681 RepID=A0ABW1BY89_9ACTN|nr:MULTISPECIES: hypothetical protein [Nonomuraea]MDA0641699.1 hypothetical protein [Nonomuraea ferruginea]TXK41717.1 hypothetical protein FR742_20995 [Nonomuraea sp. C10]
MDSRHLHDPLALTLVSTHATSDGVVSYLRCACGAWEVRTSCLVGRTSGGRGRSPSTGGAHSS